MLPYRLTKQRELILAEIKKLDFHPTAEEVYVKIKKKLPGMGLCTVYRSLEKFHELGLVDKIKGVPVRYEANPVPHNHLKCIKCGRVEDLMMEIKIDVRAIERMGYKLHTFNLEINGICAKCQKNT